MARGSAVGVLNRLIFLVVIGMIAFIGVTYVMAANPFHQQAQVEPTPVLIGQIQQQYKMETAEVTSSKLLDGKSFSSLVPFSKEQYQYLMVVTMTAGIDMSTIKDSDITITGQTVTLRMPAPQVLRVEQSGQVISHNRDVLSGFSEDKNLLDKVQQEGKRQVIQAVLEQGELMRKARVYAEDNLRTLILQSNPTYRTVNFIQSDAKVAPPADSTKSPR